MRRAIVTKRKNFLELFGITDNIVSRIMNAKREEKQVEQTLSDNWLTVCEYRDLFLKKLEKRESDIASGVLDAEKEPHKTVADSMKRYIEYVSENGILIARQTLNWSRAHRAMAYIIFSMGKNDEQSQVQSPQLADIDGSVTRLPYDFGDDGLLAIDDSLSDRSEIDSNDSHYESDESFDSSYSDLLSDDDDDLSLISDCSLDMEM